MHRPVAIAVVVGLTACGPSGIALSGEDTASESQGDGDGDGDGDGNADSEPGDGDGDGEPGDGDGEPGDGDGDGDGDGEPGDGDGEPDLPPIECEPLLDGSVLLDATSTPADFAALGCVEEITGDLEIVSTTAGNLAFLSSLVRVGGQLRISGNDALLDLTGLDALEDIGGRLSVHSNDGLLDLTGLGSLHSLHGLSVSGNDSLISVAGLSGEIHLHAPDPEEMFVTILIGNNDALTSLDGLADITSLTVERPLRLSINYNDQLGGDLFGLSNLVSDEQQLHLAIIDNALDSLEGLEGLTTVTSVDLLGLGSDFTSLVGLDNLTTVTGALTIGACLCIGGEVQSECQTDFGLELLESLDGLESLVEVGQLKIWGNEVLADIDGLSSLASVGDLFIEQNPMLPAMAVTSLLAGIEVTGMLSANSNGDGEEPICGFIPQ